MGCAAKRAKPNAPNNMPSPSSLLERAVAAAPGDFACLSHLASLCNQMGQLNRAMAIYAKIAPMRRGDSILLNNIASVYFDLGYIEKAIQFYQKAAEADAGNYLPHANLAYLGALLGDKELSGAHAAHLRRLSPHHRYQPFAKTAEFRALLLEGQKAQALALLERATVEDKQNLLFNLQRLIFARELGLEGQKQDMIARNLLLAREALHKGYAPHKTYYRITLFQLIGGHHAAAMQSARSAIHEGPYKGILRFAGLFYLDELGVAPKDGVRRLWKEHEEAIQLEESG